MTAGSQRSFPAFGAAAAARFYLTGLAAAAGLLEVVVEVVFAVIERDLIPRFDRLRCHQHHFAFTQHRLGIRLAGMVRITTQIPPRRTVNRPSAVDLEQIFRITNTFAAPRFCGRDPFSGIGDDVLFFGDRPNRKQAKPGARSADTEDARWHECCLITEFLAPRFDVPRIDRESIPTSSLFGYY